MIWENMDEDCDVCECSSLIATTFTLNSGGRSPSARRAEARARGAQRRLHGAPPRTQFTASLNSPEKSNMTSEDISFYAGNSPQGSPRPCSISPCMDIGFLPSEMSPSRFTTDDEGNIIERRSFGEIDYNSMDSGYGVINENRLCFKFVEPCGVAPKRLDTTSPPKTSNKSPPKSTSCFRPFSSLSSDSIDSMEDEIMALLDMDSIDDDAQLPTHFNSIISGDIKSSPEVARPAFRRCLSLPDNQVNRLKITSLETKNSEILKPIIENISPYSSRTENGPRGYKRAEVSLESPILSKRHKTENEEKENIMIMTPVRNILKKSISLNDANIMSALARSSTEPDLIGDFSKPFSLPLMEGRHRDLKSISIHTMAKLLKGEYSNLVASLRVVDCRYPYEYEGGHIRGAKNVYTQDHVLTDLVSSKTEAAKIVPKELGRNIIIFHCEFSSERGPKLSRFLRNQDRLCNTNVYPALHYPEVYLLHGGYKEFFESYSELCDPINYRAMLDPSYNMEYKQFRAQTKSWNGDSKITGPTNRCGKTRSRLVL